MRLRRTNNEPTRLVVLSIAFLLLGAGLAAGQEVTGSQRLAVYRDTLGSGERVGLQTSLEDAFAVDNWARGLLLGIGLNGHRALRADAPLATVGGDIRLGWCIGGKHGQDVSLPARLRYSLQLAGGISHLSLSGGGQPVYDGPAWFLGVESTVDVPLRPGVRVGMVTGYHLYQQYIGEQQYGHLQIGMVMSVGRATVEE